MFTTIDRVVAESGLGEIVLGEIVHYAPAPLIVASSFR